MPFRKPKPCHSKKAAKSNFPQIRSLDPNQAGRDVVEDIMEGGRERWCFSPPRTYPSSIFSSPQIRNRDPDQRGRDIPEEIMAKGQGSKDSSPPGGHRSSTPTQQQIRNLDPEQCGRDIPEEIMAEGQGSKDSSPPGGHRSSRPTQQQYRDRQPYVRRPQQYQDHRTYEPRPGPEGRHPHYPEQYPSSRGAERTVRNRDPDQCGRDIPEEIMAKGQGSKDSSPPGGHRSSRPTQQQYRDRQPYVRRPQQYQDQRTYEPRPGPEGRQPHYPEQYPSSRGAERKIRNLDPDQRGRDIPEEIMAEGRGSRDSSPPGGHRSSRPTQQQYRDRQPYVRRPQQYQDHRTYEPRPGPEGRHPHYPEQYPSSRGAERTIRNRDPDQRGRDIPEEIMAEGRGSRDSSPPGGHRSSRPTQQQYRDRQPYVRRPQQYQDHRTYEPRPGPEGRQPHYPEQYPSSRTAERTVRNLDPDQRGRDIPEEIMAEGRESRDSSPPGRHRSSNLSPQQYHYRQPYVRPTQQYYEHRSYEPRPGPEGRQPHYPERPVYSGANRMIRNRDPDQRGRDDTEEIVAEGQGSKDSSPPGGHRSSPSTPQQHSKRPGKQTPTAVDPTTQPILMNKKEASDTKPGPDDEPKLQPVGLRSSSPGLVPPDVQPKNSGNACKPVMKRVSLPAEPESDITPVISPHSPQDLFKEFSSILNRQTPQKFLQLVKQVKDSPIDTEEQLKGVVDLLFEKAMDETSSLVAYAKMCNCLATLTVPTPDKPQKTVNFRKLLISRCHEELEKLEKDKVDDVVKDMTRRRSIGNIKFIGELFKVKMLNDFIVHDCLDKLLTNNDEVALECLCILLTVISKDLEYNETKMDHYFNSMEDIVTEGKTSPRIRYMLQDTIDLVSLNLVPRKAEQDPKPVQQIHNEATIEDQEEPRSVQQPLLSEDTKIQPDDAPTLQPAGLRSASPGLVLPEAPVAALQPQASSPAQVPTPPQNQGSEARGTLESRTGSSKKRRRRRKHNNQLQTAGLRSASPGLVLPEAPGESGEAQATTPPREPELPLPASLSPPSIIEELLNFNNSKQPQCLHSDASSSEATLSEGSWSPWELQKQMLGIMLEDMACDSDIFDCVKEKLERRQKSSSPYLMELMTAVCQAAVKENTSCPVHAALLQKGLPVVLEDRHSEKEQQMKALKDLQELIVTLDRPPNLLRMFFTCMCEEDISSEDSCIKSGTGKDQDEQLGKGVALQTVTAFFTWLREAEPQGN